MKEYSLSDTSDSVTAIIAYTIKAMNNCGFSKTQVDRYIKMVKSLSYNELVDLSNSIIGSCNDYIEDLYNDTNEENKKLEERIACLEKLVNNKNEAKSKEQRDLENFTKSILQNVANTSTIVDNFIEYARRINKLSYPGRSDISRLLDKLFELESRLIEVNDISNTLAKLVQK